MTENDLKPQTIPKANVNRLSDLRDNTNINIMSETDPRNPYGPNFSQLPREVKIYYKFLRMKAFVHVSQGDSDRQVYYTTKFYYTLAGAALVGLGTTYLLNNAIISKKFPVIGKTVSRNFRFFGGIGAAFGIVCAYDHVNDEFIDDYCVDFLDKYKLEAIKHGFDDYDISEDKGNSFWKKVARPFKNL